MTDLCVPARLYLVISLIAIGVMLIQNLSGDNVYCLGSVTCDVPSVTLIFIIKILYVIFWTWVLNLICKSGNPTVSWLLVLFPFVLFFVLILLLLMSLPMGQV